jgi:uncharacterized protein YegP (UPF0339 family)
MIASFEIKKTTEGRYMFHLRSASDQILLTSQTYATREGAEHGIVSVKQNAGHDERYEEKTGTNGEPYFVLHAANRLVLGRSEMYPSTAAMRKAMESVKKNGPIAGILDLSAHAAV